jgi:uncharacterized protein (TIGR03067 family)
MIRERRQSRETFMNKTNSRCAYAVGGVLCLLLCVSGRTHAETPKTDAKKESEKVEGSWTVASWLASGSVRNAEKLVVKISGGSISFVSPLPQMPSAIGSSGDFYEFKIDASRTPKRILMTNARPHDGQPAKINAIYRLDGDKLELCYNFDPAKRGTAPKSFDGQQGSGQELIVLKRTKAASDAKEKK